jgi:hypothetical protein
LHTRQHAQDKWKASQWQAAAPCRILKANGRASKINGDIWKARYITVWRYINIYADISIYGDIWKPE